MRYVVAALLLVTTLTIARHALVQAAPTTAPKSPGAGGQETVTPESWLIYDTDGAELFGPFKGELGCLRVAETLNQYAMEGANDPYVCRTKGTVPEAQASSGSWVVYDDEKTAVFGPFASQETCAQLAKTLNNRALEGADDPYACRAKSP
jgi:hypothetical protein